ncbi:hypothetical protein GCM10010448_53570 [Streptomyces glomeratus]|uniref:Uncharacterized protein n=1 Tax=Streptomyces glomeratus TaxID=284452 RepID=A0ABP6M0E4_9ACTN
MVGRLGSFLWPDGAPGEDFEHVVGDLRVVGAGATLGMPTIPWSVALMSHDVHARRLGDRLGPTAGLTGDGS